MTIGCSVLPSALRARMEGTVVRLPGTGEGVARLVLVSIVTFDMARLSTRPARIPPARNRSSSETPGTPVAAQASGRQVRRELRAVVKRLELIMFDRRLVTDIGLALLIAFPAVLPAAPTPWSADDKTGKPSVVEQRAEAAPVALEAVPQAPAQL